MFRDVEVYKALSKEDACRVIETIPSIDGRVVEAETKESILKENSFRKGLTTKRNHLKIADLFILIQY